MCSASYALKKQSRQLLTETDDVLAYSVRWMLTGFQPAFNNHINRLLRASIPLLIRHFIRRTKLTPRKPRQAWHKALQIVSISVSSYQINSNFFGFTFRGCNTYPDAYLVIPIPQSIASLLIWNDAFIDMMKMRAQRHQLGIIRTEMTRQIISSISFWVAP